MSPGNASGNFSTAAYHQVVTSEGGIYWKLFARQFVGPYLNLHTPSYAMSIAAGGTDVAYPSSVPGLKCTEFAGAHVTSRVPGHRTKVV